MTSPQQSARQGSVGQPAASAGALVEELIQADQFAAVRQSVLIAIPVNMLLGLAATLVALHAGDGSAALVWFAASTFANLVRIALCRLPLPGRPADPAGRGTGEIAIDRQLRLAWQAAFASGCVWALVPALCDGYTSAQTLFFLTVTCGITAGAVTHGTSYARIPVAFIAPPLLSAAGCLFVAGGFDRTCLAVTVLLYFVALVRSARQSEAAFREASRLKNEATTLARSLEEAHARSSGLAEEMRLRAIHDPLTGLLNRAGFMQAAENRPVADEAPCLMLLDLDGFKSVNDVFGHATGDRVLVEVARRIEENLPPDCVAARLGGDEFAVFYDARRSSETPPELAGRVIAAVGRPFESFDAGRLGISVGIHQAEGCRVADMLTCADEALYAAKRGGRNRFCTFDDGLRARIELRRDSERDLRRALARGEVEVWFQPIFGGGGRVLSSLEALVRWKHPTQGWIPPSDLIAAAAMAGFSDELLRFILDEACAMLRTLERLGHPGVRVAINVSPREMSQLAVDEIVLGRLGELGLSPARLEIEITEETAMDVAAVRAKLTALSRAGLRLAMDDFGVGYSSLSILRQLRVDRVKIDRCFVTGISRSDDDKMLVQAILSLGEAMRFDVVAEGVETAADLSTLQAVGCQFMQGFHLGRPLPPEDLIDRFLLPRATAAA